MIRHVIIVCVTLLSGCATFIEHHKYKPFPIQRNVTIELRELKGAPLNVLGKAEIYDDRCVIYLRKYPQCLAHELRHCFEGNWHEGRGSDTDCYTE